MGIDKFARALAARVNTPVMLMYILGYVPAVSENPPVRIKAVTEESAQGVIIKHLSSKPMSSYIINRVAIEKGVQGKIVLPGNVSVSCMITIFDSIYVYKQTEYHC